MQYETEINDLIQRIKTDASVIQPWRNYAIKCLMQAQANIRMGVTSTSREDPSIPSKVKGTGFYTPMDIAPGEYVCTCPKGGIARNCPVHGVKQ